MKTIQVVGDISHVVDNMRMRQVLTLEEAAEKTHDIEGIDVLREITEREKKDVCGEFLLELSKELFDKSSHECYYLDDETILYHEAYFLEDRPEGPQRDKFEIFKYLEEKYADKVGASIVYSMQLWIDDPEGYSSGDIFQEVVNNLINSEVL